MALLVLELGAAPLAQSLADEEPGSSVREPAVLAGPIPEKITSTSAVVWWQTTAPEESILVYGTAPDDQPHRVQRPWRTSTHEVSVRKLRPRTTYYLAILRPDGTRSAVGQFTTHPVGYAQDNSVRITNGPLFGQITPDSATIAWSANLASSFLVRYGSDPQNLDQAAKAPWTPTTHRVMLQGLRPDTHYYFAIEASGQLPGSEQAEQESSPQAPSPASGGAQVYAFRTLARGQQALNIGPRH